MQEATASPGTATSRRGTETPVLPRGRVPDALEETRRFFLDNYPLLLDGALPSNSTASHFIHEACANLARGGAENDMLPAAVLRETLDSLSPLPRPVTKAGMTAVGPRRVRVWWDRGLLGEIDDILAATDRPRLVLRFYDVTGLDPNGGRWNNLFDIDIDLIEQGKSVDFWSPDRMYVVDLGVAHADGRFQALARTNTAEIPREAKGNKHPGRVAKSNITPRKRVTELKPEAEDYAWAEQKPDSPNRDLEAEALMRRLYRLFLVEGPRALRFAATPARRPESELRREFAERSRRTKRFAAESSTPKLLVARLDRARPESAAATELRYPMATVSAAASAWRDRASYFAGLIPVLRSAPATAAVRSDLVTAVAASVKLEPLLANATPVFEAAKRLGDKLAGIVPAPERREKISDFGGLESRRFAKAGVRFTRMSLTLEGKMRPGSRLKVAGRLVYPDADGTFRLECILSGKRVQIPMSAGPSASGEVRGVVNVDWEKKLREKHTVR